MWQVYSYVSYLVHWCPKCFCCCWFYFCFRFLFWLVQGKIKVATKVFNRNCCKFCRMQLQQIFHHFGNDLSHSATVLCGHSLQMLRSHLQSKTPILQSFPVILLRTVRRLHLLDVQTSFRDYEAERRTFRLAVPQKFNFARDVVDVWASAEKVSTISSVHLPYNTNFQI